MEKRLTDFQLLGVYRDLGIAAPQELEEKCAGVTTCCGGVEVYPGENCPVCGEHNWGDCYPA